MLNPRRLRLGYLPRCTLHELIENIGVGVEISQLPPERLLRFDGRLVALDARQLGAEGQGLVVELDSGRPFREAQLNW